MTRQHTDIPNETIVALARTKFPSIDENQPFRQDVISLARLVIEADRQTADTYTKEPAAKAKKSKA